MESVQRRKYWIEEIQNLSGRFGEDSDRVEKELGEEIQREGNDCLIDHLRLCGDIPESYGHDTSEEKLYSKYTDSLLNECFKSMGLKSLVLRERADAADVEAFAKSYSFVADAKAFRLSRTAKNQKDFKIQAMDGWKRGKPYATVVCPIYQLPTRSSQIYQQAITRNVCILTYSHLSVLSSFAQIASVDDAEDLLLQLFESIKPLHPSKEANAYWVAINKTLLAFSPKVAPLWAQEKVAASAGVVIAKEIALTYLASEREKIMRMTHDEAVVALLRVHKIETRMQTIMELTDSNILSIT
jgi:type II restriction enzyme